jgi:hypothetical protein
MATSQCDANASVGKRQAIGGEFLSRVSRHQQIQPQETATTAPLVDERAMEIFVIVKISAISRSTDGTIIVCACIEQELFIEILIVFVDVQLV